MPSLFARRRSSVSNAPDAAQPASHPISAAVYSTTSVASAPIRDGAVESLDEPVNGQRRGSVSGGSKMDNLKAKMASGKSKGLTFLQTGSSSLNVSTEGTDMSAKGAGGRRGSLGGYRMGAASASNAAINDFAGRRGSVSGPPSAFRAQESTAVFPARRVSMNLLDGDDAPPVINGSTPNIITAPPPPALASTWKPLQPERKSTNGSGSPVGSASPTRIMTSTSEFTQPKRKETPPPIPPSATKPPHAQSQANVTPPSSQSAPRPSSTIPPPTRSPGLSSERAGPRGPRPTPGRIAMPPPPSLVSRQSTRGGSGRMTGLSIVPSTPVPRPIANLPTLNGNGGGPSRKSFEDYGFAGTATPTTTTPSISRESSRNGGTSANPSAAGQQSPGPGGSNGSRTPLQASSPVRGMSTAGALLDLRVGPSPLGTPNGLATQVVGRPEARRARSIMPVMLREPSQRVIHPVDDGGNVGDSDDDDDDGDSDSSSPEGSDDDGDSSATETEEVPRRYGSSRGQGSLAAVGAKALLAKARRGSKGVASIAEEGEVSGTNRVPSGGMSDRRQAPQGGLGKLPDIPASPRNGATNPSLWGLPTPKTPGPSANSPWNFSDSPTPATSWTQFGSQTPTATPGWSPFKTPAKTPMGNFNMPPGVAAAAAIAKGQQTSADVAVPDPAGEVSYFDAPRVADPEASVDSSPARPLVENLSPQTNEETAIAAPASAHHSTNVEAAESDVEVMAPAAPLRVIDGASNGNAALGGALPPPPQPAVTDFFSTEADSATTHNQIELESAQRPHPNSPFGSATGLSNQTAIAIPTESPGSAEEDQVVPVTLPTTSTQPQVDATPQRPSFYTQVTQSAVDLHSQGDTETDDRVDPTFAAAVREHMVPSGESIDTPSTSPRASLDEGGTFSRPTPSRKPSALDWTLPPPTPGVGMKQPFNFSMAGSPRVDSIKKLNRGSSSMKSPQRDGSLARRKSMTELKEASPPDYVYPVGATQAIIKPREEEGREPLPDYWCSVHIEGFLPRKMEFMSPGLQAKDRAWKRYYMVLHGTSLSIYKNDPHKFPIRDAESIIAVDRADVDNLHVHLPGERRASVSNPVVGNRRPSGDQSAAGGARRPSASGSDISNNAPGARRASNASMLSNSVSSTSTASSDKDASLFSYQPDRAAAGARRPSASVPPPQPDHKSAKELAAQLHIGLGNQLVKRYSLQNAESGLASDYKKRTNVVRVRVEGEQFLLHTDGPRDVVDWIEAFQAATNVSLDLDVRPMPKIITLPRRRRRRPAGEAGAQPASVAANDDTPEGNARAVAEAERASREGRLSAMDRALAEDQAHQ